MKALLKSLRVYTLTAAVAFVTVCSAHATYYGCDSDYYVAANYSGQAYNKEVSAVYVHAGVLEDESNGATGTDREYWASVLDQKMDQVGGHFFTKFKISGTRGGGDGALSVANRGPVIQYFVVFTDGSTLDQPAVASIPVISSHGGAESEASRQAALNAYSALADALSTSATEFYAGSGCQY